MEAAMTYKEWIKQVDKILFHKAGIKHDVLDNGQFRLWFNQGDSPKSAASTALIQDGFPEGLF
jgi:hypothetical protein